MTKAIIEDEKRRNIRIYFFPKPEVKNSVMGCWIIIVVTLFIGFVIWGSDRTIGGIILGVGALMAFAAVQGAYEDWRDSGRKKQEHNKRLKRWDLTNDEIVNARDLDKPTDAEIDTWLSEDLEKVCQRAIDKLGLVHEDLVRDAMVIYGPLFWKTYGIPDDELVNIKGRDDNLRFSCYQLVVVCLSSTRIAVYSANFNFLRYAFVGEKTVEYLYQDIVSVSTEDKSTNYTLPNGKTLSLAQVFRLAVPSGDNIEVVVNSPEIKDLLGAEPKLSDHEQSVRAIREMLRQKKG